MGLLDQLWDDTVAGPLPDTGLGKLRKFRTSSLGSNSGKARAPGPRSIAGAPWCFTLQGLEGSNIMKPYSEDNSSSSEEKVKVTRSITIVKPPGYQYGSPQISPVGSTPPVSPFSGGGGPGSFRFRRRSMSDAYDKSREARPRSPPPPYDV